VFRNASTLRESSLYYSSIWFDAGVVIIAHLKTGMWHERSETLDP
jgi:hypothetical protein